MQLVALVPPCLCQSNVEAMGPITGGPEGEMAMASDTAAMVATGAFAMATGQVNWCSATQRRKLDARAPVVMAKAAAAQMSAVATQDAACAGC